MALVSATQLSRMNFLVVEDNMFMLRLISTLMRSLGATQVRTAVDGREAIESLMFEVADVILTDWRMPGMHGREFVKWVRQSPNSPDPQVPILLITGANERADIREARDAGITEFVTKPVSAGSILKRLSVAMQQERAFVHSPVYVGPCRRRRSNGPYFGEMRRASDQPSKLATPETFSKFREQLRRSTRDLKKNLSRLTFSDRGQLHNACESLNRLGELARHCGDGEVYRLMKVLANYLGSLNRPRNSDKDVVEENIDIVDQLLGMDLDNPLRSQLIDETSKKIGDRLRGRQNVRSL